MWVPIISGKNNTLSYHAFCIGSMIPLGGILLVSKEILYQAYTDLTTFTQALEVCLPVGEGISPELALLLLPFEPVKEQQLGGGILLISAIIVFGVTYLLRRRFSIE